MGRTGSKVNEEVTNKEVIETKEEVKESDTQTADLVALIAKLQAEISELKSTPQVIVQRDSSRSKKIKCINTTNNEINVSTDRDGAGRTFTFSGFGDYKMISYDYLSDIVASYPYTMGHGLIYIADRETVEELGLSDEYESIYTPEMIEEIVYLRRKSDVDLLVGMEKNLLKSSINKIAELYNAGEAFDYNDLKKIKDQTGYDIEDLAKELKLADKDVDRAEKEKLI